PRADRPGGGARRRRPRDRAAPRRRDRGRGAARGARGLRVRGWREPGCQARCSPRARAEAARRRERASGPRQTVTPAPPAPRVCHTDARRRRDRPIDCRCALRRAPPAAAGAGRSPRKRETMEQTIHRGLEGVNIDVSSICHIDGAKGELIYRGYDIRELANKATFEEVVHLLWEGELPTRAQLDAFKADIARCFAVPQ